MKFLELVMNVPNFPCPYDEQCCVIGYECECEKIDAKLQEINAQFKKLKALEEIVEHQAKLESLWLLNPSITEALHQAALRHLHAVIEGSHDIAEAAKQVYWNVESEL